MATVIRASCGDCGDVELGAQDLTVRVCLADDSGTYVFRCPSCSLPVVKPAERRIVDLLVASGVPFETWDLPAELSEERPEGELTHDDLIDFHQMLQGDDWMDDLFAPGR
jgi:hypothetical protein